MLNTTAPVPAILPTLAPASVAAIEEAPGSAGVYLLAFYRAGYELRLVRVWAGRGRECERALKGRHNLAGVCPICRYRLGPASDAQEQELRIASDPAGLWSAWAPSLAASAGPTGTREVYRHVR